MAALSANSFGAVVPFSIALWVMIWHFRRHPAADRFAPRFLMGLLLGGVLTHMGWALGYLTWVAQEPLLLLNFTTGFAIPYLPLGILLLTPYRAGLQARQTYYRAALSGLPLACAVARLGCFFSGCCHGLPSSLPWAVDLEHGHGTHPTQLYEVALLLLVDQLVRRNGRYAPSIALMGFGLSRIVVEPLRAVPELGPPWFGPLPLSLAWLAVGAALAPVSWLRGDGHGDLAAFRNRAITLFSAGAFARLTLETVELPTTAQNFQQIAVAVIGYGHFVGAVTFGKARMRARIPEGVSVKLFVLFAVVSVSTLLSGYSVMVQSRLLFLSLLAVATWHFIDNDLMMQRAYEGDMRMHPLPRQLDPHLLSIGWTFMLMWLVAASLITTDQHNLAAVGLSAIPAQWLWLGMRLSLVTAGALLLLRHRKRSWMVHGLVFVASAALLPTDVTPWVSFGTLYVLTTLYHLLSWLVFVTDQTQLSGDTTAQGRARLFRMARQHAFWVVLALLLLNIPSSTGNAVAAFLFSPALYLFWSLMHVGQTAWTRGLQQQASTAAG